MISRSRAMICAAARQLSFFRIPRVGRFAGCMRDGRIVYSRLEGPLKESNLWEIPVDPQTARVRGKPRRLTNWSGFFFTSLSASLDSRRLFFISMRYRSDIDVAELKGKSRQWTTPRR